MLTENHWTKSSLSSGNDNCVEVRLNIDGTVSVRHSKQPEGPVLEFTGDEWSAFADGAAEGEFDLA